MQMAENVIKHTLSLSNTSKYVLAIATLIKTGIKTQEEIIIKIILISGFRKV